jgi:hypothetical protein
MAERRQKNTRIPPIIHICMVKNLNSPVAERHQKIPGYHICKTMLNKPHLSHMYSKMLHSPMASRHHKIPAYPIIHMYSNAEQTPG